jgi:hypothetical protein
VVRGAYRRQGIAEKNKSWRVIWQILSDLLQRLVDSLFVVIVEGLSDLVGILIDHI